MTGHEPTIEGGAVPLGASAPESWKPGDRVIVRLPDRSLPRGRGGAVKTVPVHGTVRAVDEDGSHPGVRVYLDREINGVRDCYATHAELIAEDAR